jgi:protein SCO1
MRGPAHMNGPMVDRPVSMTRPGLAGRSILRVGRGFSPPRPLSSSREKSSLQAYNNQTPEEGVTMFVPGNVSHLRRRSGIAIVFALLLGAAALIPIACNKTGAPEASAKRYHLVGKVISIDQQQSSAMIDGEDIPGFMAAMAMPYPVHDAKALSALGPGDEITADVVVTGDGAYLENIVVTKKGSGSTQGPPGMSHQPQAGEKVPEFALVNQDGKTIGLDSFPGKVLLVTFIYTRCPFPDFCPLVSKNFSQIYAQLRSDPALEAKIQLLSVSFDSAHDTPAVLRRYAGTFSGTTGGDPFDRWAFATVPATELPKIADFFGLYYKASADQIVHSMSTTVISPDGTVFKWYQDNDWRPADLIEDATESLQQENRHNAGPSTAAPFPPPRFAAVGPPLGAHLNGLPLREPASGARNLPLGAAQRRSNSSTSEICFSSVDRG